MKIKSQLVKGSHVTSQTERPTLKLIQFSLLGLCIIASYGFARPVTDSLFYLHHSSQNLPKVFLLSALATAGAMAIYNHFNTRHSLLKLLGFTAVVSSLLMVVLLGFYVFQIPGSVYMLYVWREVYMVLLVEIFWSLADSLFSIKTARKSYGLILAIGTIGGIVTNQLVGFVSVSYGSQTALLGVIPCLCMCALLTWGFSKNLGGQAVFVKKAQKTFGSQSLTVVRNSKYLVPLLFLIAIVQIAVSLIDIQFAGILESTYTDVDVRTGIIGKIHSITDVIAIFLQFFASTIIRVLGMGGVFIGIPLVIGTALVSFIVAPKFLAAAVLKVSSKCFDYSIFRASKEMLYIPLSQLEKTQGKALIDILVYRIAKSSAALLMIFLIATQFSQYTMHIALCLMIAWILLAITIVKRYRSVVDLYHEES